MPHAATKQGVLFKNLSQKAVVAKFDQSQASSDDGAVLLKACDEKLNLSTTLASCLSDDRQQSKITHSLEEWSQQRPFAIACGYADGNDAARLADDPVMKLPAGRDLTAGGSLASQPTLSRFENAARVRDPLRLSEVLVVTSGSTVAASVMSVENNALQGVGVYRNSFIELNDSVVRGGHNRYAIQVWSRSAAELSSVTSTGNTGDGIAVSSGSYVDIEEGTITNNGGRGVLAQRAAYVEIANSTITGNAIDIEVRALSLIGWEATDIDAIDCDGSVLTFLDAVCPE